MHDEQTTCKQGTGNCRRTNHDHGDAKARDRGNYGVFNANGYSSSYFVEGFDLIFVRLEAGLNGISPGPLQNRENAGPCPRESERSHYSNFTSTAKFPEEAVLVAVKR